MAQQRTVRIAFDQNGGMKILAEGFTDNSCAEATKVFENAFSGKSRRDEQGPEYGIPASATPGRVQQRF